MNNLIQENVYGHAKRLGWLLSHIPETANTLEFGCGTGFMITLPIAKLGRSIIGIDSDRESIRYGQQIFRQQGFNCDMLKTIDLSEIDALFDAIIVSEVFEHLSDTTVDSVLEIIKTKLKPGGKILVTVPNGYGWFEVESYIWNELFIGRCLERTCVVSIISELKQRIFGKDIEPIHPSTLSSSPHIQRFTLKRIQQKLIDHGFNILDVQGSVLFCGQFSNLFFTGINTIMKLNTWIGRKFPRIAAGFYIAATGK